MTRASASAETGSDVAVVLSDATVERILLGDSTEIGALVAQVDDPAEAQRQIVTQILSAESADEVLAVQETVHARDLVGVPLTLNGVRWLTSKIQNVQIPVFALVSADRGDDGSRIVFTSGAVQIMAQLLKLSQLGAFPIGCVVRQKDEPTASGFYPMWLETVAPATAA